MTDSREIISTRVFSFSRELAFRAWTEPEYLACWWGPKGFTNTFHEFDLRPGGHWRFTMHGPNGVNYPNESVFVEIIKNERIVFNHISSHKFQVTATFIGLEGKTKLIFRMLFETSQECGKLKGLVVPSNEQNFDRLEAELAKMARHLL